MVFRSKLLDLLDELLLRMLNMNLVNTFGGFDSDAHLLHGFLPSHCKKC
jgi:hypothetical protein